MLSQNNDKERLSKGFHALTEISEVLISELLSPVVKKIVSLVERANVDATMFWNQPAGVFRA